MAQDVDIISIWEDITGSLPVFIKNPPPPEGGTEITTDNFLVEEVVKNSTSTEDYVLAGGETVTVQIVASVLPSTASGNQDVYGRLLWVDTDTTTILEVIEVTRGNLTEPIERSFTGNGKIIRIEINNNSAEDLWCSTRWLGYTS